MRRAERLYRITDYLRSRRRTTATWLARRLDVSVRTIYRDIADLERAGVPVRGEAGRGYVLERRMDLPPLLLDRTELAAVEVGLRFVRAHAGAALGPAASSAQAKIRGIVPPAAAAAAGDMPVFVPAARPSESLPFGSLLQAVERRAKVLMGYRDEHGADTERTVWPLAMMFVGRHWIAAGWCELRDGFRSFRLDRVRSIVILEAIYPDQPGRRLADFFQEMEGLYGLPVTEFDPDR